MLEFRVEWLEAPGVASEVLAETWGRLTITATDINGRRHLLSRLISAAARSERAAIYGSVFPLAEWVVENWWFLLYEPSRIADLSSGRRLAALPALRSWVRRHSLLAARHGGALPDVSFYRDHDFVVARSYPDPFPKQDDRPMRFVSEAEARLDPREVERGLEAFVLQVLARLESVCAAEVDRLRAEWNALCDSRRDEAELCGWSASMGLDPYDPRALTEELVELLIARLPALNPELRTDLVEATSADTIAAGLNWIGKACGEIGAVAPLDPAFDWTSDFAPEQSHAAFDFGYRWADRFRKRFQLETAPIKDLPNLLHTRCQWPWNTDQVLDASGDPRVNGLVAPDANGAPRVVRRGGSLDAARFVLARALFFVPLMRQAGGARLVTKAYTWQQAASRAFAAELLAPAEALRSELSGGVSQDCVERAAAHFGVSAKVIEHQLDNHHLGWVEDS